MKAVLIPIQPKWVEKIVNGEKTIEVRKTTPKEVPFKCYIYCTKASKKYQTICGCMVINTDELYRLPNGEIKHDWSGELMCCNGEYTRDNFLNGKVIGEFVCDKVDKWECKNRLEILESFPIWRASYMLFVDDLEKTCLTYDDLYGYGKGKTLYGLHISDLKIYDKPKELSQFHTPPCEKGEKACVNCKWLVKVNTPDRYECECYVEYGKPITRAPQSWQYVEEL